MQFSWTTSCCYYLARTAHFYCPDCAACSSLQRIFLASHPPHTYGTTWYYQCCACPHADCIGCSALHPCSASLGFDSWKRLSFFLEQPPPFALAWVPSHSFSVRKAFLMCSRASSNLRTLWGTQAPVSLYCSCQCLRTILRMGLAKSTSSNGFTTLVSMVACLE